MKDLKRSAKKKHKDCQDALDHMNKYLKSDSKHAVMLAESFLHILDYHLMKGDLRPKNVHLIALLRRDLE